MNPGDAQQESMEEVIARIETRAPAEVSDEDIISAIHERRR